MQPQVPWNHRVSIYLIGGDAWVLPIDRCNTWCNQDIVIEVFIVICVEAGMVSNVRIVIVREGFYHYSIIEILQDLEVCLVVLWGK